MNYISIKLLSKTKEKKKEGTLGGMGYVSRGPGKGLVVQQLLPPPSLSARGSSGRGSGPESATRCACWGEPVPSLSLILCPAPPRAPRSEDGGSSGQRSQGACGRALSKLCSPDSWWLGSPPPPCSEGWRHLYHALSLNIPSLRVLVLRLQRMKANYRLKVLGCWP